MSIPDFDRLLEGMDQEPREPSPASAEKSPHTECSARFMRDALAVADLAKRELEKRLYQTILALAQRDGDLASPMSFSLVIAQEPLGAEDTVLSSLSFELCPEKALGDAERRRAVSRNICGND